MKTLCLWVIALASASAFQASQLPSPPGTLVSIGGDQRLHLNCTGSGSPVVVFESGAGDFSWIWSLVQPEVSRFTRACSYDRAGYAWSDPGARPRTFSQLALELKTLLHNAGVPGAYVLVGQSFGASLVRGYAKRYPSDVAGMVLVDAVHEDGYVVYGGQAHHLRDQNRGRIEPTPQIARSEELLREALALTPSPVAPLSAPLDRMSVAAQQAWQWAASRPVYRLAQPLEMEWSPDEAEREYQRRRDRPAALGDIPLLVLARTRGGYRDGMNIPADKLEELRRSQQGDLAKLSTIGALRFAPNSGHNIHLEDPAFTIQAIREVVDQVRKRTPAAAPPHLIVQPDAIVWRGQPGQLQTAIAEGNPQAAGPFTMLLKLPDGVWIPPHFHNVDKRLVVIKGELLMGHGDTIDVAQTTALKTGGIAVMPANTHHYEGGRGETIVALIANGPFTTTMVRTSADVANVMAGQRGK